MSRINDALKQAQKNQPQPVPSPAPPPIRMQPLPPVAAAPAARRTWTVPALVIALIVASIVIIGLASTRHAGSQLVAAPVQPAVAQPVAEPTPPTPASSSPVAAAAPAPVVKPVAAPEPPMPVNPPDAPRLQGIFYSPNSPSAIVDGQMVRPGDRLHQYRVRQINKTTVILVGSDGKAIQLNMN